jgi:hypothetical protein
VEKKETQGPISDDQSKNLGLDFLGVEQEPWLLTVWCTNQQQQPMENFRIHPIPTASECAF